MVYNLVAAVGFAALYGETALARNPAAAGPVALFALLTTLFGLAVPPLLSGYTNEDIAPFVLSQLTKRAALGTALVLLNSLVSWLLIGRPNEPALVGELYLYSLIGVLLFQGLGTVMTRHVMYLQQTHQYNSNQLAAVLLMITLLVFVLVLYFFSFDLSRPPEMHPYLRDLLAISLTLLGYGRAVYLMAHH